MNEASLTTEGAKEVETRTISGSPKNMEALKKAMEDASVLRDIILVRQSVNDSLRSQEAQNIKE